jgi:hypothetical protein
LEKLFFLRKQKFASEFFCPWHNVSSQKEHIFLFAMRYPVRLAVLLSGLTSKIPS